MKRCNKCKEDKDESLFANNKRKKDGLQTFCKACAAAYARHLCQTTDRMQKIAARNKENRARNRKFVWDYLKDKSCIDCGESDTIVLEFDHQHDKVANIADMSRQGYSIESLTEEINKCVVRCANCRRRKTAKDFGWYKDCI